MLRYALAALAGIFLSGASLAQDLTFPANFRTQDIATNGTTLHTRIGGQGPAVVLLHPAGKAGWLEAGEPVGLARVALTAGARVLLPDLRLRGELAADWLHNTILWGRPEAGMAAHDLSACVDYLWLRGLIALRNLAGLDGFRCRCLAHRFVRNSRAAAVFSVTFFDRGILGRGRQSARIRLLVLGFGHDHSAL